MKRYRYGDPTSTKGRNRVVGQVVKFFIGWNIIGYVLWQFMKKNASDLHPEFEKKSATQQIRYMLGYKDNPSKPTYRLKFGGSNIISFKKDKNLQAAENDNTDSESKHSENFESEKSTSSDS